MNADADKLSLLDKAHDQLFLLSLLAFALLADLLLVLITGTNLWTVGWQDVGSRPGLFVVLILAYGVVMTGISGVVWWLVMDLLGLVVPAIQVRIGHSKNAVNPDPRRYVSLLQTRDWLAGQPDAARRLSVEQQIAELKRERQRLVSISRAAWVGFILVLINWSVSGTSVAALDQVFPWAPWVVVAIILLPCISHTWVGMSELYFIELPELAEVLFRKKIPAYLASSRLDD